MHNNVLSFVVYVFIFHQVEPNHSESNFNYGSPFFPQMKKKKKSNKTCFSQFREKKSELQDINSEFWLFLSQLQVNISQFFRTVRKKSELWYINSELQEKSHNCKKRVIIAKKSQNCEIRKVAITFLFIFLFCDGNRLPYLMISL